MDTHAAIGLYNLNLPEAQRTGEAKQGIIPFCSLTTHPSLAPFQEILRRHNPGLQFGSAFAESQLQVYPGSPAIISAYLREHDRLVAVEKHPEDAKSLKHFMGNDPRLNIHERDAWEAMGALIPPPEKRLMAFIDPPFEKTDEMESAVTAIEKAWQRVPTGIYALWYPIKDMVAISKMHERIASGPMKKALRADVLYRKDMRTEGLNGSGMVIINAPWKLDDALRETYALLAPLFEAGTRPASIEWLTGE